LLKTGHGFWKEEFDLKSIEESQSFSHIERDDKRISCSPLISIIRAPPEEAMDFLIPLTNHITQKGEKKT